MGFILTKRRRRRTWEDDEKRSICAQAQVPGVSVSQVARRYDVNANLVFRWLKDPRFMPAGPPSGFLPVELDTGSAHFPASPPIVRVAPKDEPCLLATSDQIEITVPGGCTVRVRGAYDPGALARLVRDLSA